MKRMAETVISVLLMLCLLFASVACTAPQSSETAAMGTEDGECNVITGETVAFERILGDVDGIAMKRAGPTDVSDPGIRDTGDSQPVQAGTLTARELCDLDHWESFLKTYETWGASVTSVWNLDASHRVALHLTLQDGTAAAGVRAVLRDAGGNALWSGVSDVHGDVYLYYRVTEAQTLPATVSLTDGNGTESAFSCTGAGDYTATVGAGTATQKLDLLLMVDTTGSMGDELQYFQTELDNVLRQIGQTCSADIRISVNFYRDEGDEYVVRPFAFTSNLTDALADLAAQTADAGGDMPEAVHTALRNAVAEHDWEQDAVKLVLFVLDAPAHTGKTVSESLATSVTAAAENGIRILPVVASGMSTDGECLMRTLAALTGGTYTFLTDESGISVGGHLEATTDVELHTEYLNRLLVRIVASYLGVEIAPLYLDANNTAE